MKRIVIGNFEYRDERIVDGRIHVDILQRYKNEMFGAEDRLRTEGWTFDGAGNAHKENMHIHNSLFKNEYSYIVIATVEWNKAHDEFNVCSVGMRAFTLAENEFKDFKKLLNIIYDLEISIDE